MRGKTLTNTMPRTTFSKLRRINLKFGVATGDQVELKRDHVVVVT